MKTAVLISGQTRSFDVVWRNQYWQLYRKLPDPHFFISVADDADSVKLDRIYERFPRESVHIEKIVQPQLPEPDPALANHSPYGISKFSTVQGVLRQIWAFKRNWEFMAETMPVIDDGLIFLRCRTDIAYHWFEMPKEIRPEECWTPWWSRWGGINDRLAVMGSKAARAYFTTHDKVQALLDAGAPLHPENLMRASLEMDGVQICDRLRAWFSTMRKDGTMILPDPMIVDIVDALAPGRFDRAAI